MGLFFFFREETVPSGSRSFSGKRLSRALIQAAVLWPHLLTLLRSPEPVRKGYSTFCALLEFWTAVHKSRELQPSLRTAGSPATAPKSTRSCEHPYLFVWVPQLWIYHTEAEQHSGLFMASWAKTRRRDRTAVRSRNGWQILREGTCPDLEQLTLAHPIAQHSAKAASLSNF